MTGGETHGPVLTAIVDGVPAGIPIESVLIDNDLARRQGGYGRGGRMKIETDKVEILSGVRFGRTLGSPVTLQVRNLDFANWTTAMSVDGGGDDGESVTTARPGHADLPGALKYGHLDVRNVLERASARETAVRVAAGAMARAFLVQLGATVVSQVISVGNCRVSESASGDVASANFAEGRPLRMADDAAEKAAMAEIDRAVADGTTLGGEVEVIALGVPPGLGSHVSGDRRLDARLALALMSIPAIKAVGVGAGAALSSVRGDSAFDEIFPGSDGKNPLFESVELPFHRITNRAGGIEGGISNGSPIVVRAYMKPIPTQGKPLRTVDVVRFDRAEAHRERSDACAVPACSVVAEAMMLLVLADAFLEKFGGDALSEVQYNYRGYLNGILRA